MQQTICDYRKTVPARCAPLAAIVAALSVGLGLLLTGCGSGNHGTTAATAGSKSNGLALDIDWPPPAALALSKQVNPTVSAPTTAGSVSINYVGALEGTSFTEIVNAPTATTPLAPVTSTTPNVFTQGTSGHFIYHYVSSHAVVSSASTSNPLGFTSTTPTLQLTFYAGPDGTGNAVAQTSKTDAYFGSTQGVNGGFVALMSQGGSTPLVFTVGGSIQSVTVPVGQSVPVNITQDLNVTVTNTLGQVVALR